METIADYIASCPPASQSHLRTIHEAVRKQVPEAEEKISYSIASMWLNKRQFIYFAGYKGHVSIHPVPNDDPELNEAFEGYKTSGKGTIQFPLDKPLPMPLIKRIITALVERNQRLSAQKKKK
jgi:uncharacterized protein YdhG (YjbR/CyaY superfamily)